MVGRSLIRISYFLVLFYLFTNVDRILFSSAQQKYTRRQFPSSEAHQPLCLLLRTSINIPSQGSETASFTLHYHTPNVPPHLPLHLTVKALHSANTEQTSGEAVLLCSPGAIPYSPLPISPVHGVMPFIMSNILSINKLNSFSLLV